ncbi:uncharacterized protein LOC122296220 [Carya illinoinensis]|uniref:uncharacterized protein LOC122296220 n=1 Tax=Carya illinoinensis TaxID=32201 RepID=UPI001C71C822|nr:uncharacterized protein LOC122296220 [Carya illinoinensis]
MSLLVWNYRGLGNPRSVRILSKLVKEKGPLLVFLVENKCSKQRMEVVRRSLKMDGCFDVESVGMSGGIALLWKEEWEVQVVSYTRWHVSAVVKEELYDRTWHFTGFYGHPETAKRKSSWQLLEMLKPQSFVAWLCAGDFNEVLHQKEKQGASSRPYNQIEAFRQAVERCGLYDVHHLGQHFTWSNNIRGKEFTKERIDRAMANKEWKELFRGATCTALAAVKSDHSPLYINKQSPNQSRKRWSPGFRYEAAWDLHEDCHNIVANGWKSTRPAGLSGCTMRHRLETCQRALQ